MLDDIRVVEGLAQALDRDDFNAAARFLSDNCVYDSPGGLVIGRDAIRGGSGCLNSSPRKISGFLPGLLVCGASRVWRDERRA